MDTMRRGAAVTNDGREGINAITGQIVSSAIEVHRALGPGLLESVYERCMAYELIQKGLRVETQKDVPIRYKDVQL
jgi:GxxExxY protein